VLSTDLSGGDYWEAYRGGMELFYWSNLDPVLNLNRIKINC
jgi:S-formylglutathione hydrolase FrmB